MIYAAHTYKREHIVSDTMCSEITCASVGSQKMRNSVTCTSIFCALCFDFLCLVLQFLCLVLHFLCLVLQFLCLVLQFFGLLL